MSLWKPDPKLDLVLERVVDVPRELVWAAWTKPEHVVKWFTPAPWTTTHCEIDLRPGGKWRFVMHGPEGGNYNNECTFLRIEPPGFIAWEHVSPPYFHILARFDETAGTKTQRTWTMRFRTTEERAKIIAFVQGKNEENLDRLEAELAAIQ